MRCKKIDDDSAFFMKMKREIYWSRVITSFLLVCVLASLRAKSLASDPELTKKQTLSGGGRRLTNLSA